MKRTGFEYKIYGQVVFTGKELWLLKQCADGHYDHGCRTCFGEEARQPYDNFGTMWIQGELLWDEYRRRKEAGEDVEWDERFKLEDCLEAQTTVKVDAHQLDFCMKILEPTNRYVLEEQADRQACGDLSVVIQKVFHEINEEWHQQTYGIGLKLTDDFRWHAVEEGGTEYWHDLETPRVRELAEEWLEEPGLADNLLVALGRRRNEEDVAREDR